MEASISQGISYNIFLYSQDGFIQGNDYSDHFTEQMEMLSVDVVHSILNELAFSVELDLDISASRMFT